MTLIFRKNIPSRRKNREEKKNGGTTLACMGTRISICRVRTHTATRKDLRFVSLHVVLTLARLMAFVLRSSFKHVALQLQPAYEYISDISSDYLLGIEKLACSWCCNYILTNQRITVRAATDEFSAILRA